MLKHDIETVNFLNPAGGITAGSRIYQNEISLCIERNFCFSFKYFLTCSLPQANGYQLVRNMKTEVFYRLVAWLISCACVY